MTRELGSLVRTDTVLISPFFLKVRTVITGLSITDFLSLRLRELVYYRYFSLINMLAFGMANHPIHLLSYPQSIIIPFIPY